ncbi:MAG: beta-ketoacyl synthase [Marinospirillum sp.]|uniref:beta-ketoacyl synthase N-terminal-like domain-containing protein n=1 Tax=Marinospirillum sp. TaxID=2183934 RepID=UPI001A091761|nr:beta-ketoacyl synthase N-terminal-like domain-containing protein [Marinospirillum sp.]MBE0507475.1 beta-ketoacyl synthase [Marinospirillum sp.]
MKGVYLNQPWLESALADRLDSAASQFTSNIKPDAKACKSADGSQNAGYFFFAAGIKTPLVQRLNRIVSSYLASCGGSFDSCLLILASTSQQIQEIEQRVVQDGGFKSTHVYKLDLMAKILMSTWGFASSFALNTACTSAANALIYGARLVEQKIYRQVLVVAYETPSELTLQGFGSLGLNSQSGQYRPFHPERDGLILGEAYAAVLLSDEQHKSTCARLLGGGSGCDTSNMTSTREDGSHIYGVAKHALQEAGVKAEHIQLIKHHGTGTDNNDRAEAAATQRIFPVSSPASCCLKPWLGHTLGACGLAEVVLLMYCISNQLPIPAFDYAAEAILHLPTSVPDLPVDALVMANFSGFGGNNASLILQGVG